MSASFARRRCVLLFVEQKRFVYAWHRIIVFFQVQFLFFSERWTYKNIMVSITFAIKVAQNTYIRAIQVNLLIYWYFTICTSIFCL